jgi:hypothetical protein
MRGVRHKAQGIRLKGEEHVENGAGEAPLLRLATDNNRPTY